MIKTELGSLFFKGLKNNFMLLLLMLSFVGCTREITPGLLGVCKEKSNELRLLYLDSKGICKVATSIVADTLVLNIRVSDDAKQEFYKVKIIGDVKYIKYGNVIKEIEQLDVCAATPRSGDNAVEYLKSIEQ